MDPSSSSRSADQQPRAREGDPPREHLGPYALIGVLGMGGMGLVHRARDPRLGRDVALKVLHPGAGGDRSRARLVLEARALARVTHPNVLTVYDVGEHDGVVFVALELVEGDDLARWLRARARTWPEILEVFAEIADGLSAVHAAGIVHRDVKPANVLIERTAGRKRGRVRVADFGLARLGEPEDSGSGDASSPSHDALVPNPIEPMRTADGHVVGTPAYMAPEQHRGASIGPQADQFALGVALFEALFRHRPFTATTSRGWLAAKLTPPDEPPTSSVPPWVWSIVARALQPAPGDRFPSMAALRDALRAAPRRRRQGQLGVAGLAIALGLGLSQLGRADARCDGAAAELAVVWNHATRDGVAQAFAASPRPYAANTWDRIGPRLDAFADAWVATHGEACRAAQRGELSDDLLDRAMECLAGGRDHLAGAVAVLGAGGNEPVDHADRVVASLPAIAACGDRHALAQAAPPPPSAIAERAASVRRTIADAVAQEAAGRYVEADATASVALTLARELDDLPLRVEALAAAGDGRERVGAIDDARALLEEGIWAGLALGYDEPVARMTVTRAWIAGEYDLDLPAAEHWAGFGRAALRRIGEPPLLSLQLENTLGAAYANAEREDEAVEHYRRALALAQPGDAALDAAAAAVLGNLGNLAQQRGALTEAKRWFEAAVARARARLGDDHPLVLLTEVRGAHVLDQLGEPDAAIVTLRRAIAGLEATSTPSSGLGGALLDLAMALRHVDDDAAAGAAQTQALAVFEAAGDPLGMAYAHLALGESCLDLEILDAATLHLERAVTMLEDILGAEDPRLGRALCKLAELRTEEGRNDEAQAAFERAAAIAQGASGEQRLAALAAIGLAGVHRGAGRYPAALAELDRHDARLAELEDVRDDDRVVAGLERVALLVDAGWRDDLPSAMTALAATIDASGATLSRARRGEAELALGRAHMFRGDLAAARDRLRAAIPTLAGTRASEQIADARRALADCDAALAGRDTHAQ